MNYDVSSFFCYNCGKEWENGDGVQCFCGEEWSWLIKLQDGTLDSVVYGASTLKPNHWGTQYVQNGYGALPRFMKAENNG